MPCTSSFTEFLTPGEKALGLCNCVLGAGKTENNIGLMAENIYIIKWKILSRK